MTKEEIPEIFSVLCSSVEMDKTQEELVAWKNIMDSSGEIDNAVLLDHVHKFPANFCNTWSHEEMIAHLRERIAATHHEELEAAIAEIIASKKDLAKRQKELYEKYDDSGLVRDSMILQKLGTTRFVLKHCWSGAETLLLPFLQSVAARIGVPFDTFMWGYNFTDILRCLHVSVPLTEKELEERLDFSVIHYQDEKLAYLYGNEAKTYFYARYNETIEGIEVLKGMTARPGIATGQARVVLVEDYGAFVQASKEFQKGDILVTTMTSPIMMQLAKNASAIVTNEGGITSHAAIIAREFGIPCLVGTHDATRVFKTGDFLCVDADNGLVKKINA